jgi:hypothetical protein
MPWKLNSHQTNIPVQYSLDGDEFGLWIQAYSVYSTVQAIARAVHGCMVLQALLKSWVLPFLVSLLQRLLS